MILYSLLRSVAGIALRWYYRDIEVQGLEHLSESTPTILLANHPNALVDALVIGCTMPTRVQLTAKGTFFSHPLIGPLFRSIGIIPLHRARDLAGNGGRSNNVIADPATSPADGTTTRPVSSVAPPSGGDRNADAFRAILDSLEARRVVLIFPEGTTHSGPELVPLKSGAARLALAARNDRGIEDLQLIVVGLVFENKSRPRSRVLVQFGAPLSVNRWTAAGDQSAVHDMTAAIDTRLRAVTLNFPTSDDATGVRRVARLLSDALDPPRPVAAPFQRLADEFQLIRRVDAVRRIMASAEMDQVEAGQSHAVRSAPPEGSREGPDSMAQHAAVAGRARALLARIDAFDRQTAALGLAVNDVGISLSAVLGARFALREGGIAVATAPLAWWGRLNHWLPFRLAGAMGRRPGLDPEEPAMHTIAWGAALVLVAYSIQASIIAWLFGVWWAALYLLSLPPSASWDLRYRDRLVRAISRMQAYRRFRRDPALQQQLASELSYLRMEAAAIGQLLGSADGGAAERVDRKGGAEPSLGTTGVAGSGRPDPSAMRHAVPRSEDP